MYTQKHLTNLERFGSSTLQTVKLRFSNVVTCIVLRINLCVARCTTCIKLVSYHNKAAGCYCGNQNGNHVNSAHTGCPRTSDTICNSYKLKNVWTKF